MEKTQWQKNTCMKTHTAQSNKFRNHSQQSTTQENTRCCLILEKIPDARLLPGFDILFGLFLGSLDLALFELRVAGSTYFTNWLRRRQLVEFPVANLAFTIFRAMLQEAAIVVVVGVVVKAGPV